MATKRARFKRIGAKAKKSLRSRLRGAMANKVRVFIFKTTDDMGNTEYRAYPGVVVLEHNDVFELVNFADNQADWKVPAGPFGGAVNETVAKGNGKNKTASGAPGAYPYEVVVNGKKAKGNSDPIIIIDL